MKKLHAGSAGNLSERFRKPASHTITITNGVYQMILYPTNSGIVLRPMPTPGHFEQDGTHVVGFVLATGGGVPSHYITPGMRVVYPRRKATEFETECFEVMAPAPTIIASLDGNEVVHLLDQKDVHAILRDRVAPGVASGSKSK